MRPAAQKSELRITVLRLVDEGEWARRVAQAVMAARGDLRAASVALDCGLASVGRWLPRVQQLVGHSLPRKPRGYPRGKPRGNKGQEKKRR